MRSKPRALIPTLFVVMALVSGSAASAASSTYQATPNDSGSATDKDPWWDDPYELGTGSENHAPDGSWIRAELSWGEMPSDEYGLVRHNSDGTFYPEDAFAVRVRGYASEHYDKVRVSSAAIEPDEFGVSHDYNKRREYEIRFDASSREQEARFTLTPAKARLRIGAQHPTKLGMSTMAVEVFVNRVSWGNTGTGIDRYVEQGVYTVSFEEDVPFDDDENFNTPPSVQVNILPGKIYDVTGVYTRGGKTPYTKHNGEPTFEPVPPITSALKVVVVPYNPRFVVFPYLWLKWGNPGESFYSKPHMVLVRYDGNAYDPDNAERLSIDQRAIVNFIEWNGTATRVRVDENGVPEVSENGEPRTELQDVAYRWKDTERFTSFHLRLYNTSTDNPYFTPRICDMFGGELEPTEGKYEVRNTTEHPPAPGKASLTVWTEPKNNEGAEVATIYWADEEQLYPDDRDDLVFRAISTETRDISLGTYKVFFWEPDEVGMEGYFRPPRFYIGLEEGDQKLVIGRYVKKPSYHARTVAVAFDAVVFGREKRYHKFVVHPDSDKMAELQDEDYLMVDFAISFRWFPNIEKYGNAVYWDREDFEQRKQTLGTDISYYALGNVNPISMRAVRLTEDARNKVDAWKRAHGSAAEENENAEVGLPAEKASDINIAEVLFDEGSWEVDDSIRVGATFSPLFRLEEVMENLENAGVGTELLGEMLDNLFGRIQEFFGESTESPEFPGVGGVTVVGLDEHMFEIYKQDTLVENEPDQRFEAQGSFDGELVRYEGNLFILHLTAENGGSKAEVTRAIQILFNPSKPLRLYANLSGEGMIIRRVRDWGWKTDFEVLTPPQAGGLWAARVYDNQGYLLFERGAQPATSFLSSEPEVGFSGTYVFSWWKYPDTPTEVVVEATNVWGASAAREFVVSPYVPRKLWWVQEAIKWLLFIVLAMMVWNIGVYLTRSGRLQRLPTPFEG